jgi:hypothetical protein
MEADEHIKQILLNSAEGASPGFTDAVIKRVNGLSEPRLHDQPLVSVKWQRRFLIAFGTLVMAILILCLLIAGTHSTIFNWIADINIPEVSYNRILLFIITFWVVFSVNALLQKKFLHRGSAYIE